MIAARSNAAQVQLSARVLAQLFDPLRLPTMAGAGQRGRSKLHTIMAI
jgi:hypothetical protein